MPTTLLELLLAPALVAISTLAARRHGPRIGGVVSAFPAIVGPVLLIASQEHGRAFASQAANGTLVGLVALSGFALAYGRVAASTAWPLSIVAGWALAAALSMSLYLGAEGLGSPWGFILGASSLVVARQGLPRSGGGSGPCAVITVPRGDVLSRMALTATLVAALTLAADQFGPFVGGALAALPVLTSVLAVFTHRQQGSAALLDLLRGMLTGMMGFVAFCQVIALLIVPTGAVAFVVAFLVAGAVSALSATAPIGRYARARFG